MCLMDLARAVAPECDISFIGIRPGEKLHEVLVSEDEARHARDMGSYFVIQPTHPWWPTDSYEEGADLPAGFSYTSDRNEHWLSVPELKELLES
jgi:UDP-N-acetylglucosamine 4,6-dehydratase